MNLHPIPPQDLGEVFYFLYTLGKLAKRGGGWLPSGATRGCYPQGLLELSEILISWKKEIQKENQESECLTVPRLSALASWHVYVWRTGYALTIPRNDVSETGI